MGRFRGTATPGRPVCGHSPLKGKRLTPAGAPLCLGKRVSLHARASALLSATSRAPHDAIRSCFRRSALGGDERGRLPRTVAFVAKGVTTPGAGGRSLAVDSDRALQE
jgi:hypothetical protein